MGARSSSSGQQRIWYAPRGLMALGRDIVQWLRSGEPPEWMRPDQPYPGALPGTQPIPPEQYLGLSGLQSAMAQFAGLPYGDYISAAQRLIYGAPKIASQFTGRAVGALGQQAGTLAGALSDLAGIMPSIRPYLDQATGLLSDASRLYGLGLHSGQAPLSEALQMLQSSYGGLQTTLAPAYRAATETMRGLRSIIQSPNVVSAADPYAREASGALSRGLQYLERAAPYIFHIAGGGLTSGLEQAARQYYQSLMPQLERQTAQALEEAGLAGARYSSGAQQALSNVQQQFLSDYLQQLMQARTRGAELQTQAALGAPTLGSVAGQIGGHYTSLAGTMGQLALAEKQLALSALKEMAGTGTTLGELGLKQHGLGGQMAGQYGSLGESLANLGYGAGAGLTNVGTRLADLANTVGGLGLNVALGAGQLGRQYGDIASQLGGLGTSLGQLRLATGGQLGGLGLDVGRMVGTLGQNLFATGQSLWEQMGVPLQAQYQEWLRQLYYPMEMMQWLAQIVRPRKMTGSSSASSKPCCFIFLEAYNGKLPWVVRAYRDRKMTPRNRRGYYRLADKLVPRMRRSKLVRALVNLFMVKPLTSYGKHVFGLNRRGALFAPIAGLWMLVFEVLGKRAPYIRSNGEVV